MLILDIKLKQSSYMTSCIQTTFRTFAETKRFGTETHSPALPPHPPLVPHLSSLHLQVLQKKLEVLVSEVSGLGRSRLTSVQQLGSGLQQDKQARRRDDGLSRLWEELESSIRTREQVRHRERCVTRRGETPRIEGEEEEVRVTVCPPSPRVCSQPRRFISSITMWTS